MSLRKSSTRVILLWSLPAITAATYLLFDPFANEVVVKEKSIDQLTAAQRSNISVAARAVNGCVLRPGETFSFNRVVGPRTFRRGYATSPSYVDFETPNTFGGGVCVLSSLLYQTGLEGGLTVAERHAHTRPMKTVKPGQDATVWYGGPDLKLTNRYTFPIQIRAGVENGELRIAFAAGRFNSTKPESQLTASAAP
jgi:vancomycin resistance protein YoaR